MPRAISGDLAATLNTWLGSHHYRIAIDLPSGIGRPVTSGAKNRLSSHCGAWRMEARAFFLMPAASRMGALRLIDIGIGRDVGGTRQVSAHILQRPRVRINIAAACCNRWRDAGAACSRQRQCTQVQVM
jgi:hypothetical protein